MVAFDAECDRLVRLLIGDCLINPGATGIVDWGIFSTSRSLTTGPQDHKGRKERIVTLNYKACRALKAYLAVRPKIDDEDALFLTKFEKPLGTRSIRNIVAQYFTEAAIPGASTHAPRNQARCRAPGVRP